MTKLPPLWEDTKPMTKNPLSADLHSPYINGGKNPRKKRKETLLPVDLPYDTWRQDLVARLYADSREPPAPHTHRGRKG